MLDAQVAKKQSKAGKGKKKEACVISPCLRAACRRLTLI